jgi:hypothetical protein
MTQTFNWQFGLILAYLLPGFIGLAGIAPLAPIVGQWLAPVRDASLDIGPTVYAILAAIVVGVILSCFRWVLIDHLHWYMGVQPPAWDDRQLQERLGSFDYLVQNHFRYYEFCGNTLLALLWAYGVNRVLGKLPFLSFGTDVAVFIVLLVLFAASRDALAKYYTRTGRLVGQIAEKGAIGETMFNGNDHAAVGGAARKPLPDSKPQDKPQAPVASPQTPPKGGKTLK